MRRGAPPPSPASGPHPPGHALVPVPLPRPAPANRLPSTPRPQRPQVVPHLSSTAFVSPSLDRRRSRSPSQRPGAHLLERRPPLSPLPPARAPATAIRPAAPRGSPPRHSACALASEQNRSPAPSPAHTPRPCLPRAHVSLPFTGARIWSSSCARVQPTCRTPSSPRLAALLGLAPYWLPPPTSPCALRRNRCALVEQTPEPRGVRASFSPTSRRSPTRPLVVLVYVRFAATSACQATVEPLCSLTAVLP
jgi:hypothetical protein